MARKVLGRGLDALIPARASATASGSRLLELEIDLIRLSPSKARYSHWIGIITLSEATSAFKVRSPSAGGQSITMNS